MNKIKVFWIVLVILVLILVVIGFIVNPILFIAAALGGVLASLILGPVRPR